MPKKVVWDASPSVAEGKVLNQDIEVYKVDAEDRPILPAYYSEFRMDAAVVESSAFDFIEGDRYKIVHTLNGKNGTSLETVLFYDSPLIPLEPVTNLGVVDA